MKKLTVLLLFLITATASAQWLDKIDTVTTGSFNDINPQVDHAGMVPGTIAFLGGYASFPDTEWVVFERWNGAADAISGCMFSGSTLKWDTSAVTISPEITGILQKYPDVCTVGSGTSIAAWQENAGGVWNIYYSIRDTGRTGWSDPSALTRDSVSNTNVEVRPLSDSSMALIWKRDSTILYTVFKSGGFSGIDTLVTSNSDSAEYDFAGGLSGGMFVWTDTASGGNRLCLLSSVQTKGAFSLLPPDTVAADGDISNPRFMIFYGQTGGSGLTFNVLKNGRYTAWQATSFSTSGWSSEQLAGSATASYLNGVFYIPLQVASAEPQLAKVGQVYGGGHYAWEKVSGTDTSVVFFRAGTDSVQRGSNLSMSSLAFEAGISYIGFTVWQSSRTGEMHIYSRSFLWDLGAINEPPGQPATFRLIQNYPNPFNPTTSISYQLPAVSHVTLKVYDVLGREVATLVDGSESAGTHSVVFDGSKYASGVYFYRLTAPGVNIVRKMLLEK